MPEQNRDQTTWIRYSSVGIEFAAAVGGFAAVGYWLDLYYTPAPWGLLICLALGLTGGTYNLIRQSMKAFNPDRPRPDREQDGDPDEPSGRP